ncbi:ATP-dependent RNA helicase [Theileria orientalis strain Shintoku]|uniref:ATP-dependent RNA helicase n=1 Tax=Theileria orientalis strain Shintoku TaxID=869250 RepID=J4C3D4_THEOR|nr:ATP-dependent RNA helicase [Theileria orientalis strain Shintoku]PVC51671.1 ATP-dependent RNA helicase [Theileria orientalis]BAM40246.1 ATP-dependent RNA helicase [Theileria orientalis strain Shintoku]|eukprot:XP_009690547.1 ATP-dependent RNA helicase [Theileria orientalis strain Shintoku]
MGDPLSMFEVFETEDQVMEDSQDSTKRPKHGEKFTDASSYLSNMNYNDDYLLNYTTSPLTTSVKVEKIHSSHNCSHYRVAPSDSNYSPRKIEKYAKTYPFTLDEFQKRSIESLEMNESVLVCAHTSAGKTVVAEYAIAMGLRDGHRIIYTSPIKALSNQKYRNLSDEFVDVGLMTGDVTLNPTASVMVMTTEILRSMLYRGSEIVQEMKCVIFDEVHYMRDLERGVVWEETIILIPSQVNLVFLSATIPNYLEFSEWITRIKNVPCNVVSTDFRPVPLNHYLYMSGGEGIYLVLDEDNNFKSSNYNKCLASGPSSSASKDRDTKGRDKKRGSAAYRDIESIVKLCFEKSLTPCIIFSFSKSECETLATSVRNLDMTTDEEKKLVDEIYKNAMATLSEQDRLLPQNLFMLPLLKRGIGIHHGGLLPIIKEIIEILFQESLLKVLFSTETFSMGLNMPAKTVVFTSLKKWDGREVRYISSGEYIQMSGRAGRRGLDTIGVVIIMVDGNDPLVEQEVKKIFLGKPLNLDSTFHLGYNMLLNLMRIEDTTPEYLIERSFMQFQMKNKSADITSKMNEAKANMEDLRNSFNSELLVQMSSLHDNIARLEELDELIIKMVMKDAKALNYFNLGRLVYVKDDQDWGWGLCVSSPKLRAPKYKTTKTYHVDIVLPVKREGDKVMPSHVAEATYTIKSFGIDCVKKMSQIRVTINEKVDKSDTAFQSSMYQKFSLLFEHIKKVKEPPLLDPVEHMKIDNPELESNLSYASMYTLHKSLEGKDVILVSKELRSQIDSSPLLSREDYDTILKKYEDYVKVKEEFEEHQKKLQECTQIIMKDELRHMKTVLRKLEYVDQFGIVTIKGRIACEINASDELLVAELFLRNFFEKMEPEQICASLSCLVNDDRKEAKLPTELKLLESYNKIREIATEIVEVMVECDILVDEVEYVNKLRPTLMSVVYRWAKGDPFIEILSDSSVFEGSVIRCIRRLDELLRQLACASRNIGNITMEEIFLTCISKLKKGIAFTSSLYL